MIRPASYVRRILAISYQTIPCGFLARDGSFGSTRRHRRLGRISHRPPLPFKPHRDCGKSGNELRSGESRMLRTHCRPMLEFVAAVAAAVALAGCGTDSLREMREERASVFPTNYRAELIAFMRTYLNDPTNVRDAYIAEPTMKPFGPRNQYVVCVRYNAKNTDGRYMGSKDGMALFDGGRFDRMIDQFNNRVVNQCAEADYQRFPELEALKR
jgi:hypothetical protein